MLGVRRQSVSLAARNFQPRGPIGCRRGYVILSDCIALEKAACNCYLTDCATYDQMGQTGTERIAPNSVSLPAEQTSALSGRTDVQQKSTVSRHQVTRTNLATDGIPAESITNNM